MRPFRSSCKLQKYKKERNTKERSKPLFPCYHRDTVSWAFQKKCIHTLTMCKKARVTERVNVSFVSHVDVNSPFEVMDQGDKK